MQGYKSYEEKLFYTFCLSERVPVNNFYRRLKDVLDLSFIRKYTQEYYGKEGQTSIDPVVFFQADAYWISGEHTFRPEDCGTGRNETGHALFFKL